MVRASADRRRRDVGPLGHPHGVDEVTVTVEKSGQQRAALQIDDFGRRALPLHDVGFRSDGRDFAAGDRDGLGGWMRVVHRHDVAAEKDSICCARFIHGTAAFNAGTAVPPASAMARRGEASGMDYTWHGC